MGGECLASSDEEKNQRVSGINRLLLIERSEDGLLYIRTVRKHPPQIGPGYGSHKNAPAKNGKKNESLWRSRRVTESSGRNRRARSGGREKLIAYAAVEAEKKYDESTGERLGKWLKL